jgi:hypothetical protein
VKGQPEWSSTAYISNLKSSFPTVMKAVMRRFSYKFRLTELRKRSEAGTGPENRIFQNTTSKTEVKKLLMTEKLQLICK